MHRNAPDLHTSSASHDDLPERLPTGSGWFSLGLRLTEILAPRTFTRAVGLEGREGFQRGYGLRTITARVDLLATQGPERAPWMWGRVAGDNFDIASVAVRLAQVPGEVPDDRRVSVPRGIAIKVFDVPGRKLPAHAGEMTQDFVLDTGEAFIPATARTFLAAISGTEAATPLPEAAKSATSRASRATKAVLGAAGLNRAKLDFFGHPPRHSLKGACCSQCTFGYGDYIAKLAVIPDMPELRRLDEEELHLEDENGLRNAVAESLRDHPADFVVAVQHCTGLDRMPVKDAGAEWPEEEGPCHPVARLVLPPQPARDAERESNIDEAISFCPSHSPAAHRPLGSITRARMHAYEVLGRKRREINELPTVEPRGPVSERATPWNRRSGAAETIKSRRIRCQTNPLRRSPSSTSRCPAPPPRWTRAPTTARTVMSATTA